VYGEWDPWTAGQYALGGAADSLLLVQAQGTHAARLSRLAEGDRARALGRLGAWTGAAVPGAGIAARRAAPAEPREPRLPPALARSLRARR
jgi:hypothetical protein